MHKKFLLSCLILLTSCTFEIEFNNQASTNILSNESSYNTSSFHDSSSINTISSEENSSKDNTTSFFDSDNLSSLTTNIINEHNHKEDPYLNILTNEDRILFYSNNYVPACCYIDAMYRTKHGLISGSIENQAHKPSSNINKPKDSNGKFYKLSDEKYTYDEYGNFVSYEINNLNGESKTIYYKAAYASLNEVAAYLFAFGEAPTNTISDKNTSAKQEAIDSWWKFGRVNDSYFENNTSSYPYEPLLPGTLKYYETDFGSSDEYYLGNYYEKNYNDGTKINRSACRFVYTRFSKNWSLENRHVFYTYNHYNDFQEYLNYEDGFGELFGNETAGNEPDTFDYNNPPSSYVETTLISLTNLF